MKTDPTAGKDKTLAIDGAPPARPDARRHRIVAPGALLMDEAEEVAAQRVLRNRMFYRHWGEEVAEFEAAFARIVERPFAIAMNSGTSALSCAMAVLPHVPGDEVIIPAYCFVGVAAACIDQGWRPVCCPIDATLTMDAVAAASLVTARTRAILAVHMRGASCDLDGLGALARKHDLFLIEDVAQSVGGRYRGRPLGSVGEIGCFSLQHFKILTTGEGGVLVTGSAELAEAVRLRHDPSAFWVGDPPAVAGNGPWFGANFRMSELEGAIGRVQLGKLPDVLGRLRAAATALGLRIARIPRLLPRPLHDPEGSVPLALIHFVEKELPVERIVAALDAEGVEAGVLLPATAPLPERHFVAGWGRILGEGQLVGEFDQSESRDLLGRALQIQIDPLWTDADVERIAEGIAKVFEHFAYLPKLGKSS